MNEIYSFVKKESSSLKFKNYYVQLVHKKYININHNYYTALPYL